RDFGEKRFVCLPLALNNFFEFLMALGLEIAERKILQFTANLSHAEPFCEGRVDVQSFTSDGLPTVTGQVLKRTHVVKPIRKLDHDDANIVGHREQHLSKV